jgi:putative endonuclease
MRAEACRLAKAGLPCESFLCAPSYGWHAMVMYHVYILRSISNSTQYYSGFSEDVKQRLKDHNAGHCPHTSKHRPWELFVVLSFANRGAAPDFERYLKSGSGRAFASRHFRVGSGIVRENI